MYDIGSIGEQLPGDAGINVTFQYFGPQMPTPEQQQAMMMMMMMRLSAGIEVS